MITVGMHSADGPPPGQQPDPGSWEKSLGLRERKKRATRRALHSSGLRLVAERGLDAVTIEDIVAAADVSPRTFFNYYASKEDVIVNPDPDRPARVAEALRDLPDDLAPLAAIHTVLRQLGLELQESSDEWLLRLELVHGIPALLPRYLNAFLEVERAITTDVARRLGGEAANSGYPMLVAAAATAALRTAFSRWCDAGGKVDVGQLIDEAFGALELGLVPASRIDS